MKCVVTLLFACLAIPAFAANPKTTILYNFKDAPDGAFPSGGLVADSSGNLYGVTGYGGDGNINCRGLTGCGVVFELISPSPQAREWKEQILYAFTAGADGTQSSPLVIDSHRNLYATTVRGGDLTNPLCTDESNMLVGCGIVYELSEQNGSWAQTILHTFEGPEGAEPSSSLIFDAQGNLYGSTQIGGANGGGTVFEMSPNTDGTWTENVLYNFDSPSGVGIFSPGGSLTFDSFGNLYGTALGANSNGDEGFGTIYRLQAGTWQETTIYSFCCDSEPHGSAGGLAIDKADNLYGTTTNGGVVNSHCSVGCGTIFELTPANGLWSYSTLFEFYDGQGVSYYPEAPPSVDSTGNLYGMAVGGGGCGSVWRLTTSTGGWAEIGYQASHNPPGVCGPNGTPLFGKFGGLYSTSAAGGPKNKQCVVGCGTVFAIYP